MAAFVKIDKYVLNQAQKAFNLGTDELKLALTNTAPVVATANQLSDITQIADTNYNARPTATTTSSTQTSGTYKLVLADVVFTATGAVATFQYIVLYSSTATNGELIGYWDYGSGVTLASGDTFTVDFDPTSGALTIA